MLEHFTRGTRLASPPSLVIPSSASQAPVQCAGPRRRRRAGRRGFTMMEMLAVIAIIGLLAAAASPMFINIMRDRRVNKTAMQISGFYREGRSRALGRGNAVVVRWRGNSGDPSFELRETAVQDSDSVVAANCNVSDWQDPVATRHVGDVTFFGSGDSNDLWEIKFLNDIGGTEGICDICFSPTGRAFVRYAEGAFFVPMTGVPRVTVKNLRTNLVRTVHIPPNGVARLEL